jgi:hypothetical protein
MEMVKTKLTQDQSKQLLQQQCLQIQETESTLIHYSVKVPKVETNHLQECQLVLNKIKR